MNSAKTPNDTEHLTLLISFDWLIEFTYYCSSHCISHCINEFYIAWQSQEVSYSAYWITTVKEVKKLKKQCCIYITSWEVIRVMIKWFFSEKIFFRKKKIFRKIFFRRKQNILEEKNILVTGRKKAVFKRWIISWRFPLQVVKRMRTGVRARVCRLRVALRYGKSTFVLIYSTVTKHT